LSIELKQGVDVTILGQGAVLDAINKSMFFIIEGSLTLKDLPDLAARMGAQVWRRSRGQCGDVHGQRLPLPQQHSGDCWRSRGQWGESPAGVHGQRLPLPQY
jgi:hypothetical protein